MAEATQKNITFRLSTLIRDPLVKRAFQLAERDNPPSLVEPKRPEPVLAGGTVATRELEAA